MNCSFQNPSGALYFIPSHYWHCMISLDPEFYILAWPSIEFPTLLVQRSPIQVLTVPTMAWHWACCQADFSTPNWLQILAHLWSMINQFVTLHFAIPLFNPVCYYQWKWCVCEPFPVTTKKLSNCMCKTCVSEWPTLWHSSENCVWCNVSTVSLHMDCVHFLIR